MGVIFADIKLKYFFDSYLFLQQKYNISVKKWRSICKNYLIYFVHRKRLTTFVLLKKYKNKIMSKEIAFDKLFMAVEDYLAEGYNEDDGFYIDFFNPENEIEVRPLVEMGFDMNDDGTLYRDENGKPINTNMDSHICLAEEITILCEDTGERIPNIVLISKIIDKYF